MCDSCPNCPECGQTIAQKPTKGYILGLVGPFVLLYLIVRGLYVLDIIEAFQYYTISWVLCALLYSAIVTDRHIQKSYKLLLQ